MSFTHTSLTYFAQQLHGICAEWERARNKADAEYEKTRKVVNHDMKKYWSDHTPAIKQQSANFVAAYHEWRNWQRTYRFLFDNAKASGYSFKEVGKEEKRIYGANAYFTLAGQPNKNKVHSELKCKYRDGKIDSTYL